MAAVNDLYRIKVFTSALGQNFLNVYHYQCLQVVGSSVELAVRFETVVLREVAKLLSSETVYDHLEVQNLNDLSDFTSYVGIGFNGTRTGISDVPQTALSFQYTSSRGDARSGGKRFSTLAVADINDGTPVAALLTLIANAESTLEGVIVGASGQAYRPRVYGKREGQLGVYGNPISGVNFIGIYSQNTRKFYTSPGW